MLILSKYKDYYDYLSGIYGVDPKIVLDRRIETPAFEFFQNETKLLHFYICGLTCLGVYKQGKFYWTDDLKSLETRTEEEIDKYKGKKLYNHPGELTYDQIVRVQVVDPSERFIRTGAAHSNVPIVPYKDKQEHNKTQNCPIIYDQYGSGNPNHFVNYPRLDQFKINRLIPPQDIYLMLSEWLSPKDDVITPMTDKQKIVSAGFDLKHSFRNTK